MINKEIEIWSKTQYLTDDKNTSIPTLKTYILEGNKDRASILICPGGGYNHLSERESEPVALKFNSEGFNAFVLRYSIAPKGYPQQLFDVSRAVEIIRENSEKWNVDKNKIAVCGFSAGAHLAASLGVFWNNPFLHECTFKFKKENIEPNALILCYPVITSGKFANKSSFLSLLGNSPDKRLIDMMSLEKQVSDAVPPSFIWHTCEDKSVPLENSLLFVSALRKYGIPFEYHVYPKGEHGLSLANEQSNFDGKLHNYPHVATWMSLCIQWLNSLWKDKIIKE